MTHIQHIIHSSLSVAAGLALLSCSHDSAPDLPDTPLLPGTMAVAITLDGSTRASDSGGEYQIGEELENTLNLEKGYKIMFFTAGSNSDGGGKYIASFNANFNPPEINPDGTYSYKLIGSFPVGLPAKFKIVVMANWPNYPSEGVTEGSLLLVKGETTIKDVTTDVTAQYDYLASLGNWIGDDHLIPFYGVREYDFTNTDKVSGGMIKDTACLDLTGSGKALPLLRAMAKVEVVLQNDLMSFESVTIDRYNAKGFCAPYSDSDWNFTHEDYVHLDADGKPVYARDYAKAVHLVEGVKVDAASEGKGKVTFTKTKENEKEKWVAYIPEYRNVGVGDDYCCITVTIAHPEGVSGDMLDKYSKKIYFAPGGSEEANNNADVNADSPAAAGTTGRYNIERNNVYRFNVTNTGGTDVTLAVSLDVQPFSSCTIDDYYVGIPRDEQGDIIIDNESPFWPQVLAVLNNYPEFIPRTGNYEDGKFVYGEWNDYGEFTPKNTITEEMIKNSFLGDNKDKALYDKYKEELKKIPALYPTPFPLAEYSKFEGYPAFKELEFSNFEKYPEYKDTTELKNLKDYYAIVMPYSGNVREAEVWIKDRDGCRVLSNFEANVIDQDETVNYDAGCAARMVCDFSSGTPDTYYKDKEGFRRLQHNTDHSSIVLDASKQMLYKTVVPIDNGDKKKYKTNKKYLVEKWEEYKYNEETKTGTGGDFWYLTNIVPAEEDGWSANNPNGYVLITYKYGNIAGETPKDSDGNVITDREIAPVKVRYSELSAFEKNYFEQLQKDKGQ